MKALLLAGNSFKNREWIFAVREALSAQRMEGIVQEYAHWESGDELINLDSELAAAIGTVGTMGEYMIFAKSAGTLLALKGIYERKLSPSRCVFVGTAIGWAREQALPIETWVEGYSVPTLFIQKEHDPAISSAELSQLLANSNVHDYRLVTIEGADHSYEDIDLLAKETVGHFQ